MSEANEPNPLSARSRRAILGGAAAGAAALALRGLSPDPVAAGSYLPLLLDDTGNTSSSETTVTRGDMNIGICGSTYALAGNAHGTGMTGVSGVSDGPGGVAVSATTGGYSGAIAVHADGRAGQGIGFAVKASTKNGIALYGEAVGGHALHVQGVTVFSRAGLLTVAKGSASGTVILSGPGNRMTANSFVVATIQGNVAGTWVRACSVNVAANSFTIRLNKAAPQSLSVGWFVIN